MADRNPWEIYSPTPAPRPERNPWDLFSEPTQPQTSRPWEAFAPAPVRAPARESNTLYGNAKAETAIGELGAGLQRGVRQVVSTAPALGALATQFYESLTGHETGLPQSLIEASRGIAEGGAQRGIASVEQLKLMDPSTWLRYVAGTVGEAVPFVASILAGGAGVSALMTRLAARGVAASTRAGIAASIPRGFVGAGLTGAGIETAATAQELHEATGKVYPGASIVAGSLKGAAEAVFPYMLGRAYGLTGGQAGELFDRILLGSSTRAGRIASGVAVEAGTEEVQEEIDILTRSFLDTQYDPLGPEAMSRRLNAAAAGGVAGGVFSSFTPGRAEESLNEHAVRRAAGDVPIVTGQEVGELPVLGPEEALRSYPLGLDATVSAATTEEQAQLLSAVDPRQRGLFAPVVAGSEPVFGTQDQAVNDGVLLGGEGYVRLDPSRVTRGDITAAVEDLPETVNSPRVDFTNPARVNEATESLVRAVELRRKALAARSGLATEGYLEEARKHYRVAIDNGLRVEPFSDSRVMVRDTSKLANLVTEAKDVKSQLSEAGLKETRQLAGGKKFYVFSRGVEEDAKGKTPAGRRIDLENIDVNAVTGLPSREMQQRVLASAEVSRNYSLGRARGMGIRFAGEMSPLRQQALLRSFVRLLRGTSGIADFTAQPGPVVERFMALVDRGLRLDVTPGSSDFALLRQVSERELSTPEEDVTPSVVRDPDLRRVVQRRAKRKPEAKVSRYVQFHDSDTKNLFLSQYHSSRLQKLLVGTVEGGYMTQKDYTPSVSPLANMTRDIAREVGTKADYVLEIVPPSVLPDKGVEYVEKDIVPPAGKKAQRRSVIMINPWFYGRPTKEGKKLQGAENSWAYKGGVRFQFIQPSQGNLGMNIKSADGKITTVGEELKKLGRENAQHLWLRRDKRGKASVVESFETREEFEARMAADINAKKLAPLDDADVDKVNAWLGAVEGDNVPLPRETKKLSRAGKIADKLGVPATKRFTPDESVAEFFADYAVAFSQSIVTHEWGNTGAAMQELLKSAWRREMHNLKGATRQRAVASVMPHPIVERTLAQGRGPSQPQYEFEEWLVNQVARRLIEPTQQHGPVKKFFDKVGSRIKQALEVLKEKVVKGVGPLSLDPNAGSAKAVVDQWLTQLSLRGLDNVNPPFLEQATRDVLIASINKNQKALEKNGVTRDTVMAPERASTYQVRQLLKLLPAGHTKARAKLQGLLATADRHNTVLEWSLGVHQLSDLNPHIEELKVYVSAQRAMENRALSWASIADKRLREAQKLGKTQLDGLWGLIFDLDNMVYLDQKKLDSGEIQGRWPRPEELLALARKHKIGKSAFKVYQDIRNDLFEFISHVEAVSIKQAEETISDPDARAARVQEIRGETEQIRARPYFPHMRFGRFLLTVRNAKNKVVHFEAFERKEDRDKASVEIAKRYKVPAEGRIIEDEASDVVHQWQGLPGYALRNIIKAMGLDEDASLLTNEQKKQKRVLETLAEASLPTQSFRQQLRARRRTPGYSLDGMRAYANYFARSARFMARMEYARTMELAIEGVRKSGSVVSKDARTRIADYMKRHFDAQMEPSTDLAELRALGFMWYFAFAPAAAVINLTQVPMVAMPFLASKFGDLKTMGRTVAGYTSAAKELFSWLGGSEVDLGAKAEAIEEAHFTRVLDDGYASELTAISQGSVLQRTLPGTAAQRNIRHVAQWGTLPFQLAERMNRSVTFRAAYDLALARNDVAWIDEVMEANKIEADQLRVDRGWEEKHLRAYMAAVEAVRRTQFEYSRWARPKLMEGPRGVVFMFKTYLQNMLYYMFKNDRGTQVRYMLLLLGTAGLMGMPGAEDMGELVKFLSRQLGTPIDVEREVRKLMVDWGADDYVAPDVVLHGASREGFGVPAALSGFGVPAPRIDLSGSLSMGRLVPGLKEGLNPNSSSSQNAIGDFVSQVAGPVFGIPFALYQAMSDTSLPADDPKRWERAMPRMMKALSRTTRYMTEQRERDRSGATVYQFDPNDTSDQLDILLATGLGFQPTRLSQQWDYIIAQKEVLDYWRGQRNLLMREFWRSVRLKDKEGRADVANAIRGYNREVPHRAMRITREALKQSLKTRRKNESLRRLDLPREKHLRGIARETQQLFPEVISRKKVKAGGS